MPVLNWFATTGTYTARVTWAIVECWGGGGAGGGATGNPAQGGGGGGGGYSRSLVTTTPGTGYAIAAGTMAVGGSGAPVNGNPTSFDTTTVVANAGSGGTSDATAGTGSGAGATAGTGNIVAYAGARGGNCAAGRGAPGGGCAGFNNDQTAGSDSAITAGAGGTPNPNTGNGGAGRTTSGNGNNAGTYGGGGGGAYAGSATDRTGGNGAAGYCRVYWPPVSGMTLVGCG